MKLFPLSLSLFLTAFSLLAEAPPVTSPPLPAPPAPDQITDAMRIEYWENRSAAAEAATIVAQAQLKAAQEALKFSQISDKIKAICPTVGFDQAGHINRCVPVPASTKPTLPSPPPLPPSVPSTPNTTSSQPTTSPVTSPTPTPAMKHK